MIKDIFTKVKSLFTGDKSNNSETTIIVKNYTYDSIKKSFNSDITDKFGSQKDEFLNNIKKICRTRKIFENESIILISKSGDFSITQSAFLFKKDPNIVEITDISQYNENSNMLYYINQNNENWKNLMKSGIKTLQYVTPEDSLENVDYYFFGNVSEKLDYMLNLYIQNEQKVIGWSANKSHYERGKTILHNLKSIPLNASHNTTMSEQIFLMKLQNGSINFNDLLFILNQTKEIMNHPLASKMGMSLTPDKLKIINQKKSIICAMTTKERENMNIIDYSRMSRIAKGSGVDISQVEGLITMLKNLKEKSSEIASMAADPRKLAELMKSFQQ